MGSIRSLSATGSRGVIITARKRAEYALRNSEPTLAGILAIAGDAIVSIDAGYRISLFNEAAERMFGYSPAEVLGQPIDVLIPTRFHAAHKQHIDRFASGPDIARRMGERQEVVARRKDGDEFPTEASISKLDVGGERFYTVVLRDVTERKRAEDALRNSEAKLAGILAIAGDAIVSIDAGYRISLFNEAVERMFSYSPAEVLGQPIDVLIPSRFHAAHRQHIVRFASLFRTARRMGERQEVVARRKDGDEFPTEASISKLDVGGERFYTVVLRDVTERKRTEKHQGQLVAELDHRVKNVLARVAAVAMYTG